MTVKEQDQLDRIEAKLDEVLKFRDWLFTVIAGNKMIQKFLGVK